MTVETVERWLELGQETPGIEWKSATTWNPKDSASLKIVRGMLAMANLRGGGHVVIGVTETRDPDGAKRPKLDGMTAAQAASLNYDAIADFVRATADPPVTFERHLVDMGDGKLVVVLSIDEFEHEPVICVRTRNTSAQEAVLKEGTIYYRNHGSVASKPIASGADMRALVQLATRKELQRYRRIHREVEEATGSQDAFMAESEDF